MRFLARVAHQTKDVDRQYRSSIRSSLIMDLALFVHKPLQPLMEVSQTGGIVMRDSTTFGCVRPTPDFRSPLLKRPRSGAAQGAGVKRGTGETGTERSHFATSERVCTEPPWPASCRVGRPPSSVAPAIPSPAPLPNARNVYETRCRSRFRPIPLAFKRLRGIL